MKSVHFNIFALSKVWKYDEQFEWMGWGCDTFRCLLSNDTIIIFIEKNSVLCP